MDIERTRKNILIVFLLVLVLGIVLVAGFFVLKNKSVQKMPEKASEGTQLPDTTINKEIIKEFGITENTNMYSELFEACKKRPMEDFMNNAGGSHYLYGQFAGMEALVKNDATFCGVVSKNQEYAEKCKNLFYMITSPLSGNDNCGNISDTNMRAYCTALVNKDITPCSLIAKENNKAYCQAIISLDSKACAALDPGFREQCEDNKQLARAFQTKDIKICDTIEKANRGGRFNRAYCRIMLSDDPQGEWDKAYAENVCIEKYAIHVAREKNDTSICESIPLKLTDNKQLYEECK